MTETTTSELAAARRAAFRPITVLLAGFLGVSAAMIAAIVVLTATGDSVDIAVWIRCSIVLASSILPLVFARGAARGSRSMLLRLRIFTPIILAAIIVIVSIPNFLPVWVRIEQGVCGALLLPAVILMFLPRTSALFPRVDVVARPAVGDAPRA
ncbi:hypothetical protein [Humibacter ginsenosidimutans]|uniref:Uncharacterized protein n=1 Tax=Humibacter ginsenosidimutans TaxID=2599293 RepID=A0A5B8M4E4_9MICO|nr:hypothetical protein [Humibacter ginsenosidimutans]QDZ15457.1 hypothetical protein FPZ11_12440 [Humibacter ginsenosidimutans]